MRAPMMQPRRSINRRGDIPAAATRASAHPGMNERTRVTTRPPTPIPAHVRKSRRILGLLAFDLRVGEEELSGGIFGSGEQKNLTREKKEMEEEGERRMRRRGRGG